MRSVSKEVWAFKESSVEFNGKYSLVGVIMNERNTTAANKAYERMK